VRVCGLGVAPGNWNDFDHRVPAAITAAAAQFPIMDYDRPGTGNGNGDGLVGTEELTILVLEEWDGLHGQAGQTCVALPGGGDYCGGIATASSWGSLFVWAHELGHTLGGDDLYENVANFRTSVFASASTDASMIVHMDAWHKLRLGWLRPELVDMRWKSSDERLLYCAGDPRAATEGALLFHDPDRGNDAYFLVEARCKRDYDEGTPMAGVATWQIQQQDYSQGSSANFSTTRDHAKLPPSTKSHAGCTAIAGGFRCKGPSVCLHDTRADNQDVCFHARFLSERSPLLAPMSLQWADRTWAGVDLRATPAFEYVDYGIPGYRHVEVHVGYRVAWTPRVE
jgi:M6 family metalloprotease-like protein